MSNYREMYNSTVANLANNKDLLALIKDKEYDSFLDFLDKEAKLKEMIEDEAKCLTNSLLETMVFNGKWHDGIPDNMLVSDLQKSSDSRMEDIAYKMIKMMEVSFFVRLSYNIEYYLKDSYNGMFIFDVENECRQCGKQNNFVYDIDNNAFSIKREMLYKDGKFYSNEDIKECSIHEKEDFSVDLVIESGKILVANDLRSIIDPDESIRNKSHNFIMEKAGYLLTMGSYLGLKYNTEFWAKHGLFYLHVGNTCPTIFWYDKHKLVLIKDDIFLDANDNEIPNYSNEEEIKGDIITGLWAVHAMDYGKFLQLCEEQGLNVEKTLDSLGEHCVIDVPKGVYRATCRGEVDINGVPPRNFGHLVLKRG